MGKLVAMNPYDILLLFLIAIIALFTPSLIRLLYEKIRSPKQSIAQRYRQIEETISIESSETQKPSLIDEHSLDAILRILQSRITLASNLRRKDIELLSRMGIAEKTNELTYIRSEILNQIENIQQKLRNMNIISAPYEEMARRSIINIIFLEIEPSYGPRYKYATTPTEYLERILKDQTQLTAIFVADEEQIIDTGYSRVIIRRIPGGERGYNGIVLAEITHEARIDEIRTILGKIERIPSTEREAREILSRIFD